MPFSQIFRPQVTLSGQTHTSDDIVGLEEFVFNIASLVQKELEDLQNDVSALNEKAEILQWHDNGGLCVPVSRSPRRKPMGTLIDRFMLFNQINVQVSGSGPYSYNPGSDARY